MPAVFNSDRTAEKIARTPPRMYVQDLDTLERLTAQFNPAELEEAIPVEWMRTAIPGLSHRELQYNYTDNYQLTVSLIFDAFLAGDTTPLSEARKFLMSLCYAKKGKQGPVDGQPTRVLFVWPGLISMTCVILGTPKFKHTRFNIDAFPTYMVATIPIQEIRDVRLYSEDVRESGTLRSASTGQV